LVWYQIFGDIRDAIAREKQIKRWRREKKVRLIESMNLTWQDLPEEWGKPITPDDIIRQRGEPQVPPLGLKSSVGMTKGKVDCCRRGPSTPAAQTRRRLRSG
jgi:hypothetical protein